MAKRRILKNAAIGLCGLLAFVGFVALGNWQLERRLWKLDLIQKVNERAYAQEIPAPVLDQWPAVTRANDEYRRVFLSGKFLTDNNTLVVAATELGSGYWVLSPFQRNSGSIVFVNRGFVAQGVKPSLPPSGEIQLSGLLRMSEPKGSVVRDNDPANGRWYSRDVRAISTELGITAAPYFIDADKGEPGSAGSADPVGGLTVIQFHNSHLVYAITWYGLAIMVIGAGVIVLREGRRPVKS
jgi:surfeit locus 1 family protein